MPLSIRKLYFDFAPPKNIKEVSILKAINCKASKRTGYKELLVGTMITIHVFNHQSAYLQYWQR